MRTVANESRTEVRSALLTMIEMTRCDEYAHPKIMTTSLQWRCDGQEDEHNDTACNGDGDLVGDNMQSNVIVCGGYSKHCAPYTSSAPRQ